MVANTTESFAGGIGGLGGVQDLFQIVNAGEPADAADEVFGVVGDDGFAADAHVAGADGGVKGVEGNVVGAKAGGIDIDLIFTHETADRGDFGHAGDAVELVADEKILNGAQLVETF